MQERRQSERLEIFLIVDIKPSGVSRNYFLGLTKSISAEGFSFESQNYQMKQGEILEFEIKDPEGGLNVHAAGKIAWIRETDFECLVGVKFHGLDEKGRSSISAVVSGSRHAQKGLPVHEDDTVKAVNNEEYDEPEEDRKEEVTAGSVSRISGMSSSQEAAEGEMNAPVASSAGEREMSPAEKVAAILKTVSKKSMPDEEGEQRSEAVFPSVQVREEAGEGERETIKRSRKYIVAALITVAVISALVLLRPGSEHKDLERDASPPAFTAMHETEAVIPDKEPFREIIPELKEVPGAGVPDTAVKDYIVETEPESAELSGQLPAGPSSVIESDEEKLTASQPPPEKPAPSQTNREIAEVQDNKQEFTEDRGELSGRKDVAAAKKEADVGAKDKQPVPDRKIEAKKAEPAVPIKEKPLPVKKAAAAPPESASVEKPSSGTEGKQESSILFSTDTAGGDVADPYTESPFSLDAFASYEENFNDNVNNWQIFNTDTASARIEDGEYSIENRRETESSLIFHYHDFPHYDDFMIETDIRTVKASGRYYYGMVFGGKDALYHYTFQIVNNNGFAIIQHKDGVSKELAVGTVNNISPTRHNTMRITKQGDIMTFAINGVYLARVSKLPLFGNKIGFVVGGKSAISIDRTRSRVKI